jgi:hypothetical protein
MHRIDGPGATPGHLFTEGDPVGGVEATTVTDDWLNDVQEELISILTAAGIAPVKGTQTQVLEAIRTIMGGNLVAITATGVTNWVKPAGLKKAKVFVLAAGAGGGGAGATAAGQLSVGGGGSSGGWAFELVDLTAVSNVTCTVGLGGPGGVGGVSNGSPGGSTSFGSFLSATGGVGGINLSPGTTPTYAQGGSPGGIGSNGDVNGRGDPGMPSLRLSGNDGHSGAGAGSILGGGGAPVYVQSNGNAGLLGGGGSGSLSLNGGAATNGGPGGNGLILIGYEL